MRKSNCEARQNRLLIRLLVVITKVVSIGTASGLLGACAASDQHTSVMRKKLDVCDFLQSSGPEVDRQVYTISGIFFANGLEGLEMRGRRCPGQSLYIMGYSDYGPEHEFIAGQDRVFDSFHRAQEINNSIGGVDELHAYGEVTGKVFVRGAIEKGYGVLIVINPLRFDNVSISKF